MDNPLTLSRDTVKAEALRLGFSACGLAPAAPLPPAEEERFRRWIADGCHAEMSYLERNIALRLDPRRLVPGAQTVVSLAMDYYEAEEGLSPRGYNIARYARGRDYHDLLRERLRALMAALGLTAPADGRAFVDTAPVMERYWAERCGLGRRALNGQFFRIGGAGSYCFLAELILVHPADAYDHPVDESLCTHCGRCLRACPTGALRGDGTLDARRCLSYLTIEHRGPLPEREAALMTDTVYGCDRCAEVCPLNARPAPTREPAFRPSPLLAAMTREDWHALSPERYIEVLRGSAAKRAKYEGWLRNIAAIRAVEKKNSDENLGE